MNSHLIKKIAYYAKFQHKHTSTQKQGFRVLTICQNVTASGISKADIPTFWHLSIHLVSRFVERYSYISLVGQMNSWTIGLIAYTYGSHHVVVLMR
jgi:hypothetical protein